MNIKLDHSSLVTHVFGRNSRDIFNHFGLWCCTLHVHNYAIYFKQKYKYITNNKIKKETNNYDLMINGIRIDLKYLMKNGINNCH